jgi:hypothetical protein
MLWMFARDSSSPDNVALLVPEATGGGVGAEEVSAVPACCAGAAVTVRFMAPVVPDGPEITIL